MSGAPFELVPAEWNIAFSKRQPIQKDYANKAYLDYFVSDSSDDEFDDDESNLKSNNSDVGNRDEIISADPQTCPGSHAGHAIRNNGRQKGCPCGADISLGRICICSSDQCQKPAFSNAATPTGIHPACCPSSTVADASLRIQDPVRNFMKSHNDSDAYPTTAIKRAKKFCSGATLQGLLVHDGEAVAMVDEGKFEKDVYRRRGSDLPDALGPRDLYLLLKAPRFVKPDDENDTYAAVAGGQADYQHVKLAQISGAADTSSESKYVDAERRLIYITNLDKWIALALMYTASIHQASALRNGLERHLAFEPLIEAKQSTDGILSYELAFHLPYFALRRSKATTAYADPRIDEGGNPLRKTRDISFLSWNAGDDACYLYQAQTSCIISGLDEWHYDGHCWAETYFDRKNERVESVKTYCNDARMHAGMRTDPFTGKEADLLVRDPRALFLASLLYRLGLVHQEWKEVTDALSESVGNFQELFMSIPVHSGGAATEPRESIVTHNKQQRRDWVVHVRQLSRELLMTLENTVGECRGFWTTYKGYFANIACEFDKLKTALQELFRRLERQRKRLEDLDKQCRQLVDDLNHQLLVESNFLSDSQRNVTEKNRLTSVVMLLWVTPLALALPVFTMDQKLVSQIPKRLPHFIGVAILFHILMNMLHTLTYYHCWETLMRTLGLEQWNGSRKLRLSEILRRGRRERDLADDE